MVRLVPAGYRADPTLDGHVDRGQAEDIGSITMANSDLALSSAQALR
jgi:hypothetical protein